MFVAMPTGVAHGWGIAGQHLIEEIYQLPVIPDVTLHSINNPDFTPSFPERWNKLNVGYCFFENDIEAYRHMKKASETWDFIIAGSSWCEYHLRLWGITRTATVLQGIDPDDFFPLPPRAEDDRFIVFSGGKFELRKSQDIVIAAMKIFMDNHRDVWLSASWHNQWPFSIATMSGSPLIKFSMDERPCEDIIFETLANNGIDISRVMLHPMISNKRMREIYGASDIGIFPNRCEGGNNMVMSEYMACGRTVIASNKTGHADVINCGNAFELSDYTMRLVERNNQPHALWFEPSLDDVVTQLEYAYNHRHEIKRKGEQAAADMKRLDWKEAARQFHNIASKYAPGLRAVRANDYCQRGRDLVDADRPDLAVMQLKEALRLAPLDVAIHSDLGTIFEKLGGHTEARYHHQKAAMLNKFMRR